MDTFDQLYYQKLAASGLSNTRPRRAVFEALRNSGHKPISMNQLIHLCHGQANRASVYRSVDSLEKAKIIHRINTGWKYKLELSEDFHGHHHHITCDKCNKITTLKDDQAIEVAIKKLAKAAGFSSPQHQLEISGTCHDCRLKL